MTTNTAEIFKALADETRLGIVRKLSAENKAVASCDLVASCASFLKLSQPAISHHFGKLVSSGVLIEHKQGVQKTYEVNRALLKSAGIDVNKI